MAPKLSDGEVQKQLAPVPGWTLENGELTQTFSLPSFPMALLFVNSVGLLAQRADHHPEIQINYRKVKLSLTTHDSSAFIGSRPAPWKVEAIADFDGDGKADVLWRNTTTGEINVWKITGSTYAESPVATLDASWRVEGVRDFDGDLKADILWRHEARGEVWLWRMTGAAVAGNTPVGAVDAGYRIVATGDYDADGRADILWHHATRGEVWLWLMNGATVNSVTWVLTVGDVGYGVVAPR